MQKIIIMIVVSLSLLITSIMFINTSNAKENDLPLQYRIVIIDPGHGSADSGASEYGYHESDINLQIGFKLRETLKNYGATVYMTRENENDVTNRNHHYSKQDDMYLRVKKIDSYKGHYLISIHLNASNNSRAWGSQVFYYKNSEKGKALAEVVDKKMKTVTNSNKPISSCSFRVLRATQTLGVLVECGFLSNYNECGQLRSKDYQNKLALKITEGLIEYDKKVKEKNLEMLD